MNEWIFFLNFYQGQKTNKIVNVVSNSCGAGRAKWTTLDFGGYERLGRILKCNFITQQKWKTEKLGYWFLIPHNENCKQVIRCDVIQSVLAILKEIWHNRSEVPQIMSPFYSHSYQAVSLLN